MLHHGILLERLEVVAMVWLSEVPEHMARFSLLHLE